MRDGTPKLQDKRSAKYKAHLSLRISEAHKAKYMEMAAAKKEVTDPCREAIEPVIDALYEQFKKGS